MEIDTEVTTNIIKAALTEEAINEILEWFESVEGTPAHEYWNDTPDAVEILRDIFRGYVIGQSGVLVRQADDWTVYGMAGDNVLLDALEALREEGQEEPRQHRDHLIRHLIDTHRYAEEGLLQYDGPDEDLYAMHRAQHVLIKSNPNDAVPQHHVQSLA